MKKSKISLALVTSLLSLAGLAGCNEVTYSDKGYILTYKDSTGAEQHYTADELFGSYYDESSSLSTVFDKVYKLVVRNYFKVEAAGIAQYKDIEQKAKNDLEGAKEEARKKADTNGTSYDEEFNSILSGKNCEDEAELLEEYIYERELKEFEEQFYDNKTDHLRDSRPGDGGDGYEGYLYKKLPYHVRHILVKTEGESSSTNYWNATITESDARSLYTVANALAQGKSFGQVAKEYSDDGSADSYGDLGVMDTSTSYVNPFKLGIYAYENLYNGTADIRNYVRDSKIAMSNDIKNDYCNAVDYSEAKMTGDAAGEITTIPYGVFEKLHEYENVTRDSNNSVVNDDNSIFYPRNIYFNKYLNRFSIAFITPDDVDGATVTDYATATENTTGGKTPAPNATKDKYADMAGFQTVRLRNKDGVTSTKKVLVSSTGKPILVARAGTSDYQGIHFITIERDGLINKENGVTLSQYYTTKWPGHKDYPVDEQGNPLNTYVNFLDQDTKDYKSRAETIESKIKSFDSSLNKYIYASYIASGKLQFKDAELGNKVNEWINVAKQKADHDDELAWEETWETYINSLNQQMVERNKLVSEACAIGYLNPVKGDEWTKIGGLCNDNKAN